RGQDGRRVLRVDLAAVRYIRLVPEGVHRAGTDGIPDAVNPLRQVAERLSAGHVEYRQDALRAVEVRLLEELQEGPLAHDVQDHHVDLDRPALHRAQGHRLLRHERTGSKPSMSAIVPVRSSRGLSLTRTDNPARACFGATRSR